VRATAFRVGDLVRVRGSSRKWVVLKVTANDVGRGVNTDKAGLHLFAGCWYARESIGGVLNPKAYVQIDRLQGRAVGIARAHFAAASHCK
jgi:hypothetical protein